MCRHMCVLAMKPTLEFWRFITQSTINISYFISFYPALLAVTTDLSTGVITKALRATIPEPQMKLQNRWADVLLHKRWR